MFIDEIDSIAGKRHTNTPHSNGTINQILTELDGFKKTDNVIVVGATNLIDSIDKVIKRPGRFDKIINISLSDVKGREEILDYYLGKVGTDEGNLLAKYPFTDLFRCKFDYFGLENKWFFRSSTKKSDQYFHHLCHQTG